ncbi:Histone deacetylase 7, partial [Dissostichus eleginoides]
FGDRGQVEEEEVQTAAGFSSEVRGHGKQRLNMKMRGQCHGWISQSRMCPARGRLIRVMGSGGESLPREAACECFETAEGLSTRCSLRK